MAYKKEVIPGKVGKESKKAFKASKHAQSEKDIYILFDADVDYSIEKLSVNGLPAATADNRPISWHNNFVVKAADGSPMNGVAYSVLIDAADGETIVIYDDDGLHIHQGGVSTRKHKNKDWKEIRLSKGDPAIGIAT